jgi:Ion channel
LNILAIVAGVALILSVLWEAFEAVVLPRRVSRQFRLTRMFYRTTWWLWVALVRSCMVPKRRDLFFSYYGPLSLLFLFACWALALILGFSLVHWGTGSAMVAANGESGFLTDLYMSGTTFFTLGLGDVVPRTTVARFITVAEGGLGFGFLALIIGYLPIMYQTFSRRELNISMLDARAGSPPSAGELLRRHSALGGPEALQQFLQDWERWSAELLESHLSYATLAFFRSQHNNQSWLMALTTILDTTALTAQEGESLRQAKLTFAGARHAAVDLAQVFGKPPKQVRDRLTHAEYVALRESLRGAGLKFREGEDVEQHLTKLRRMYEPYVQALADYLRLSLPEWTKPPERKDNWQTSGWDKVLKAELKPGKIESIEEHF